jgi:hypothetical protein
MPKETFCEETDLNRRRSQITGEANKPISGDTSRSAPEQCMTTVHAAPTAADPDQILDLKSAAGLLGFSTAHFSKILSGKFRICRCFATSAQAEQYGSGGARSWTGFMRQRIGDWVQEDDEDVKLGELRINTCGSTGEFRLRRRFPKGSLSRSGRKG